MIPGATSYAINKMLFHTRSIYSFNFFFKDRTDQYFILFFKLKNYQTRVLISCYDEFISTSGTSVYIKINDYVGRKGNYYLN